MVISQSIITIKIQENVKSLLMVDVEEMGIDLILKKNVNQCVSIRLDPLDQ